MNTYLAVTGLVALGALTPGPNNLVVLDAGSRGGVAAALAPIAGVVAGSLALLALVAAGLAVPLSSPPLRAALALAGAAYLAVLGAGLLRTRRASTPAKVLPRGLLGLFAFQFANPKAWMLAASVVAFVPSADAVLFGLYAAIVAVSLTLWAGAGAALARYIDAHRRCVDVVNGLALVAFGALLAADAVGGA